jgi:hypothetical protein
MSSVGSSYAQISARTKFLIVTAGSDISGYVVDGLQTSYPVGASGVPAFVTAATTAASVVLLSAGDLLKDLGREIVTYLDPLTSGTTGSPHRQVYRQVLPLSGPTTEGVGSEPPVYVLVYDADGVGVRVARTG